MYNSIGYCVDGLASFQKEFHYLDDLFNSGLFWEMPWNAGLCLSDDPG